jgi:hypothetical protein
MEFLMYVQNWIIILPVIQNDAGCLYSDPSDHSKTAVALYESETSPYCRNM